MAFGRQEDPFLSLRRGNPQAQREKGGSKQGVECALTYAPP
jgi:hypothetical protein